MASLFSLYATKTFMFFIFLALFGTIYGMIHENIDKIKPFNTILFVSTLLILAFGTISLFYVKAIPRIFEKYVFIVSSLCLILMGSSLYILSN